MRVIHLLRKPLSEGTVASNVLKHGCGGLNIDASRIPSDGSHIVTGVVRRGKDNLMADRTGIGDGPGMYAAGSSYVPSDAQKLGRWPANVILQHLDGCRRDGVKRVKGSPKTYVRKAPGKNQNVYSEGIGQDEGTISLNYGDKDGKETIANWICEPGCPVARLDNQSGILKSGAMDSIAKAGQYTTYGKMYERRVTNPASEGGASRFYKQVGGKVSK